MSPISTSEPFFPTTSLDFLEVILAVVGGTVVVTLSSEVELEFPTIGLASKLTLFVIVSSCCVFSATKFDV